MADNREFKIENFYSAKYEYQYIQPLQEELITGKYNLQYIEPTIANTISKDLQIYKRDKELFYCSLFFIGKRKLFNSKTSKICAPLIYYPSEIIELDEEYYIKLKKEERKINYSFLKTLNYKTSFELLEEDMDNVFTKTNIDYTSVAKICRILEKHIEGICISENMVLFPQLESPTEFEKYFKYIKNYDTYSFYASSGLIVSSKANNVQNVVAELDFLKKENDFSTALRAYLGEPIQESPQHYKPRLTPFILNESQEKSVRAANEYVKSVILGPPGTGKSYTVSAIAIDYLSQGKSVLIATKTDEALEVLNQKIESFSVGRFRVKASGSRYKISLIAVLEKILYRFDKFTYKRYIDRNWDYLDQLKKRIQTIEQEFKSIDHESSKLTTSLLADPGIIKSLKIGFLKLFRTWEKKEWELIDEYMHCINEEVKEGNKKLMGFILGKLQDCNTKHYKKIQNFVNVLKEKDLAFKSLQLRAQDFEIILEALPIWLTKIDTVSEVLPLKKELFDLLIIDEATQCDISGVLPLLQRAKKVVVTGDKKQLRHISFLSKSKMINLANQNNIEWLEKYNYRTKSVLDYVLEDTTSSQQISVLDEHYRSLPEIINFSNTYFYDSSLLIMNDLPKRKERASVFLIETLGKKDSRGHNEAEAEDILEEVLKIIEKEKELGAKQSSSLGIISPFSDQVKYVGNLIKTKLSLKEIEKHKIRIGTPYSFQGDERDIIYLSLVVDDNTHHSSFIHINKEDVFNVMITRARMEQKVFYSCSINKLKQDSILRIYLEKLSSVSELRHNDYLDDFVKQVCAYIESMDEEIHYHIGYRLSGLIIDILIEKDDKYLGIDLIGYPGDYESSFSLERYKVLYRVGIEVIPLSYLTWYFDENIKQRIQKRIEVL